MVALRVRGIGKAYKRYRHKWGRLAEWVGAGTHHQLVWALKDVSFELHEGEAVGIVGANGAGKSTLMKLIAGTIRPTMGSVEIAGRVSALLELGIGFHPEFTGRQNAEMSCHMQGIAAGEVQQLMASIEEFAEIGTYFNLPVRTYSSGMQARLAFSVATVLRPDVLIIDEALSVGDVYFQHKSFDRIRRFREQGTTLLFVSHSAAAVKTLCDRAILLDAGEVVRDEMPDDVLDYYNAMIAVRRADHEIRRTEGEGARPGTRSGSGDAVIAGFDLFSQGISVRAVRSGDPLCVHLEVAARTDLPELTVGIVIRDRFGNDIYGTNTFHLGAGRRAVRSGEALAIDFVFDRLMLGVGTYSIAIALHAADSHVTSNYDWWDRAAVFQVARGDYPVSVGSSMLEVAARWSTPVTGPDAGEWPVPQIQTSAGRAADIGEAARQRASPRAGP